MSENNVIQMHTRPFEIGDAGTVLAWAVLERPVFIQGETHNNAQKAKPIVADFLSAEAVAQTQLAVICRGAFGIVLSGPAAAIDMQSGEVYVDPAVRHNRQFVAAVIRTASPYSRLTA